MMDRIEKAKQQLQLMIDNAEQDIKTKEAKMDNADPLVKLIMSGAFVEQQKLLVKNLKAVLRTLEGEQDERD